MAILIHQYDPSTINPLNLVSEEPHTLSNQTGLVLITEAGLFYTKSLIVRKVSNNTILRLNTDYTFQGLDAEITALSGFECACAIAFKDPTISGTVTLTYQAVGGKEGELSSFISELRDRIAALILSDATWAEVVNKPARYPPASHTHSVLTDLTGLASIRTLLASILFTLTSVRIPTLSGISLSNRIDRLLAIITKQRADLNTVSALVKRIIVSIVVPIIDTNDTLTNNIAGTAVIFKGTIPLKETLPPLNTLLGDTRIDFLNAGLAKVTLYTAIENDMYVDGVSVIEIVLNVNETLTLISNHTTWYKFSGTAHT